MRISFALALIAITLFSCYKKEERYGLYDEVQEFSFISGEINGLEFHKNLSRYYNDRGLNGRIPFDSKYRKSSIFGDEIEREYYYIKNIHGSPDPNYFYDIDELGFKLKTALNRDYDSSSQSPRFQLQNDYIDIDNYFDFEFFYNGVHYKYVPSNKDSVQYLYFGDTTISGRPCDIMQIRIDELNFIAHDSSMTIVMKNINFRGLLYTDVW